MRLILVLDMVLRVHQGSSLKGRQLFVCKTSENLGLFHPCVLFNADYD